MTEINFQDWLIENYSFQKRSAKDVESRLKRASNFINVLEAIPDDELIFKLEKIKDFKSLEISIKSQLKRSIKLYREYHKEIKI